MLLDVRVNRRTVLIPVIAGAVVLAGVGGGVVWQQQRGRSEQDRAARAAADAFGGAWSARTLDQPGTSYSGMSARQVAQSFASVTGGLGTGPVAVKVASVNRSGDTGKAVLDVRWSLPGGATWAYSEPVPLKRTANRWSVVAAGSRSLWHPDAGANQALTAARTWGRRGEVLDRNGAPLLAVGTVYDVQIDPARATTATVTALEKVVDEPAGSLTAKLAAAKKSGSRAPIPVVTYREADFASRRAALEPMVGVIYPRRQQPLAPTRTFGQPLLGSYGPVTAEMVSRGKGRYVAGDRAGLSGIQGQYDALLGGTAGVTVTVAGTNPATTLFEQPAQDGKNLTLALDPAVQAAAEKALAGSKDVPSALVAVDVKSGDLLAVANSPELGFNRALVGQYQPGSTLKVATTYALLGKGLSPSTRVPCPPKVTVDGLTVQNYEGETFGDVPFTTDFAQSCNTAFVGLSAGMADADVHDAARALGVGAGWEKHLGVANAFGGSVPVATSKTEKAATSFGQARTLASPAAMAVMAGSVARGSYVEPALITSPAVPGADRTPRPLQAKATGELRTLMRDVVTSGTGSVLKGVPGGPVSGKTGTAEHGSKTPPETRAWFVGWQGDVAFAVLVEEGRSGGTVAAPLAKTFLADLRR
jgi:cell division protein FtsI/penicillin-binding protein 2